MESKKYRGTKLCLAPPGRSILDSGLEILIAKDVVEFQARSKSNWESWHGSGHGNAKISRYFWNESVYWHLGFYMKL